MSKALEQAINEQNPHWGGKSYAHEFTRLHDQEALEDLELEEVQIITGIRRCGKSTLMQTMINQLMLAQQVGSILYLNFDDPNYNDICNDVTLMYNLITGAEKLTGCKIQFLFLDEIQNVDGWEKYVKSAYDSKRFQKITITGSNADLLNSDYTTLLTGRYIETRLYPMTYKELLINNGITNLRLLIKEKSQALALFDAMLQYGGFPRIHRVATQRQRRKILQSYYETILLKDCIKNHKIRDNKLLMNLAHYLITNSATRYSYNSLSKAVSSNENTIQKFIHIFEDAYIFHELKQFSFSLKKQLKREKKIYCIDNGLITATTFKFFDSIGKLLENLVYSELRKLAGDNVYFHNQQKECDFILHDIEEPQAIQVCYELNHDSRAREIKGLQAVMAEFSIPKGIIITYDQEEQIGDTIEVVPFWKFFAFYS